MDVKIVIEKGAIPDKNFFSKVSEILSGHAWYLSNGDSVVIDGMELSRGYSYLEIKKLNLEEILDESRD